MDYSMYPHAKKYESAKDGRGVEGLVLQSSKLDCTFVIFSAMEPHLVERVLEYDSVKAFEEEWFDVDSEPSILLEGEGAVTLFRKWQDGGYYTPDREEVERLISYVNDLGDYVFALEKENSTLYRKAMGLPDIPQRPVFNASKPEHNVDAKEE